MKYKNAVIAVAICAAFSVKANDEINYTWFEANYENLKTGTYGSGEAITLEGSFAINDMLYITGDISRLDPDRSTIFDNSYGLSLGFHKSINDKTDFYTEVGYRVNEPRHFKSNGGAEVVFGTRSILSEKFELITAIGYKNYDTSERPDFITEDYDTSDGGFNFGVTALYKFNKNSALHFGLKEEASNVSPMIGYRYNWN
jgi:hypothetical protein